MSLGSRRRQPSATRVSHSLLAERTKYYLRSGGGRVKRLAPIRPPAVTSEDLKNVLVSDPEAAVSPQDALERLSELESTAVRRTHSFYQQSEEKADEHYTSEAVQARAELRRHPEVVAEAGRFFHLLARGSHSVGRSQYVAFNLALQRALFDDFDQAEGRARAELDWQHDSSKGVCSGDRIEEQAFSDSMFEHVLYLAPRAPLTLAWR